MIIDDSYDSNSIRYGYKRMTYDFSIKWKFLEGEVLPENDELYQQNFPSVCKVIDGF